MRRSNPDNDGKDTDPPTRHPLTTGDGVGPYVVDTFESRDGASFRYLVRDTKLGNLCRARVFVARWCEKEEVRSSLRQCAMQQSRIPHPGVLSVRDIFEDEDPLVIVTDFIDGPTLA